MKKYFFEIVVDEEKLRRYTDEDVGDENVYEQDVKSLILQEIGWVNESGIYLQYIHDIEEIRPNVVSTLGKELTEIINQDGEEKTDGECLDEIINVLEKYGIYKKRI